MCGVPPGAPQDGDGDRDRNGDRDGDGEVAPARGRALGALGARSVFGSRFFGCPGDGAVFLWPLPPVPLTSQSV